MPALLQKGIAMSRSSFSLLSVMIAAGLCLAAEKNALAQDLAMKVCGDKWQAAKAAGTTGGTTWPKFLTECRSAGVKAEPDKIVPAAQVGPPVVPAAQAANVSEGPVLTDARVPVRPTATRRRSAEASKADAPQPRGKIVFPTSVPVKFAELRPGAGRQKACSEQYQANKSADANGGLRWREKGGGYWRLCNRQLKA